MVALRGGGAAPAADEDLRGQGAEQQHELQHGGWAEPGHGRWRATPAGGQVHAGRRSLVLKTLTTRRVEVILTSV